MAPLSDNKKAKVLRLYKKGQSYEAIRKLTGASQSTIARIAAEAGLYRTRSAKVKARLAGQNSNSNGAGREKRARVEFVSGGDGFTVVVRNPSREQFDALIHALMP